jgi:hypothetical protein
MSGVWGIAEAVFAVFGALWAVMITVGLLMLASVLWSDRNYRREESRKKPDPGDLRDGEPLTVHEHEVLRALASGDYHEGHYEEND